MCGQKQTELEPNAGRAPGEGTQRCSIYGAARSLFTSCRSRTPCATVSPVPSAPLAPDMARLALSVLLVLCVSLPQLCTARPSRTRKAVSPRQPGGTDTLYFCLFKSYSSSLHLFFPFFCARVCVSPSWHSCRRRWCDVPTWAAVAGGELPERNAGFADRYQS